MNYLIYSSPDELMHFGIKGMHWGVRRYQNPDGTLTAAGKARLVKKENKAQTWKVREINRVNSMYGKQIQKYDNMLTNLNNRTNERISGKKQKSINRQIEFAKNKKQLFTDYNTAEVNKILNMSLKDVSKAKVRKGMYMATQGLKAVGNVALFKIAVPQVLNGFIKNFPGTPLSSPNMDTVYNKKYNRVISAYVHPNTGVADHILSPHETIYSRPGASLGRISQQGASMASKAYKKLSDLGYSSLSTKIGIAGSAIGAIAGAAVLPQFKKYSNLTIKERRNIRNKYKK